MELKTMDWKGVGVPESFDIEVLLGLYWINFIMYTTH